MFPATLHHWVVLYPVLVDKITGRMKPSINFLYNLVRKSKTLTLNWNYYILTVPIFRGRWGYSMLERCRSTDSNLEVSVCHMSTTCLYYAVINSVSWWLQLYDYNYMITIYPMIATILIMWGPYRNIVRAPGAVSIIHHP